MGQENSKQCGQKCEVYRRVIGYYAPEMNSSLGKKAEYKMRKSFDIHKANEQILKEQSIFDIEREIHELMKDDFLIKNLDTSTAVTTAEMDMLMDRRDEEEEVRAEAAPAI